VVHPKKDKNGYSVSYVKTKSSGNFTNLFRVSADDVPVWCDLSGRSSRYLEAANLVLQSKDLKPVYVACYSGKTPEIYDNHNVDRALKIGKKTLYLYDPLDELLFVAVSIKSNCIQDMPVYYFSLYYELCTGNGVECCMNGNGKSFNIYAVIKDDPSLDIKTRLKSFFEYISKPSLSNMAQDASYDIFTSYIEDVCSFNRWYHGAVHMGITDPETFLDKDVWTEHFNSLKTCEIKIQNSLLLFVGPKEPKAELIDSLVP
nr:hypothetical protein [bacterium]